jgi:hypothetical protein
VGISGDGDLQVATALAGNAVCCRWPVLSRDNKRFADYTPNVNPSTSPYALVDRRSKVGFAVGLGGEAKAGRLRLRPELRYTRWAASTNQLGVSNVLQSNQNQVEFLLSFGIRVR